MRKTIAAKMMSKTIDKQFVYILSDVIHFRPLVGDSPINELTFLYLMLSKMDCFPK